MLLSTRAGSSAPASPGPAPVPVFSSLAKGDRSRGPPATKGSELSDGKSADSRSSKATCNSLASAAVSWFLAAPAALNPWRCPLMAGLRSRPRADHAGKPTDRGRGPVGSRALPLRGRGRCNGCRAAAVIHPLVHRCCDLRLAGFLPSAPPDPAIRVFPSGPVAGAGAQMSGASRSSSPAIPRSANRA